MCVSFDLYIRNSEKKHSSQKMTATITRKNIIGPLKLSSIFCRLMFSSVSALFLFGFILNAIVCPFPAAPYGVTRQCSRWISAPSAQAAVKMLIAALDMAVVADDRLALGAQSAIIIAAPPPRRSVAVSEVPRRRLTPHISAVFPESVMSAPRRISSSSLPVAVLKDVLRYHRFPFARSAAISTGCASVGNPDTDLWISPPPPSASRPSAAARCVWRILYHILRALGSGEP